MKHNFFMVSIMAVVGFSPAMAQVTNLPAVIKVPAMEFDNNIIEKAIGHDEIKLPSMFRIDKLSITLGRTTLTEVTQQLKTSVPLHDGKGYYQCYSIPRYSHQVWLVTKGKDFFEPITELVIVKGSSLPSRYCPMITATSYPIFSNKIRLDLTESLVNAVLGVPQAKKGGDSVYLYQLSDSEKLKVQTHIGNNGLDKIKITQIKTD